MGYESDWYRENAYDWHNDYGDTWTKAYEDGWLGAVSPYGWFDTSKGACFVLSDDSFLSITKEMGDCDTTEEARKLCDLAHIRLTGRM